MHRTSNKNKISVPFFNNPILNRLSHTSLAAITIIYTPLCFYFIYQSYIHHPVIIMLFGMAFGAFLWTFIEYATHRFAFHFRFVNERIKYLHSIFHLAHHKYPQDKTKYQTLLLVSLPSTIIFYYLFNLILGSFADMVYAGFVFGYIIYEYTHFSVHKFNLPTKIGKRLKQHHMHHHYFDNKKNFGVSSLLWDFILKTNLSHITTTTGSHLSGNQDQ